MGGGAVVSSGTSLVVGSVGFGGGEATIGTEAVDAEASDAELFDAGSGYSVVTMLDPAPMLDEADVVDAVVDVVV